MFGPYDIITFDCYGTLIDWERGITDAFQAEARKEAVELDPDKIIGAYATEEPVVQSAPFRSYRDVLNETAMRVASKLGWQLPPERANFLGASLPEWRPFADTNPSLERLSKQFRLGILSNIDDDLLAATRKHFTVEFDLMVTAQQVRSYKPGFAHFNEALLRAGESRLLHAAQSYFHDIVPATNLGIPVVWVNRKGDQILPGGPIPVHEVQTLADLANLLEA